MERNRRGRPRVLQSMQTARFEPTRHWRAVLPVFVGVLLTACAAVVPDTSNAPAVATASHRPSRTEGPADRVDPSPAAVVGEVPAAILEAILADAAESTGLERARIEIVRAESVPWPDGSFGCPEPDVVYTQAPVDGYQVVLDVGGEELDYRVGESGAFRICAGSGTPSGG